MIPRHQYPDEPAGPFPRPPVAFVDADGRSVELRSYGDGPRDDRAAEVEALVEMYAAFDAADRAQGIPPTREPAIRRWLETILVDDAINVIAWADGVAAGHAVLVPDGEGAYELAIFVLQDYQGAGIGSRLIRGVLGEGAGRHVERVWLTVERWNSVAVELYERVGFQTTSAESFEFEMALRLGASATA